MKDFPFIQSLEDTVVEITTWMIMLPRTFFHVARRPSQISPYFESERQKEPQDRFSEFLSPVLFWILLGPVPFFFILRPHPGSLLSMGGKAFEEQLPLAALLLLTGPLGFALSMARRHGETPVTRKQLSTAFRVQCYPFGVFAFAVNVSFSLIGRFPNAGGIVMLVALCWLTYAELAIGRRTELMVSSRSFVIGGYLRAIVLCLCVMAGMLLYEFSTRQVRDAHPSSPATGVRGSSPEVSQK